MNLTEFSSRLTSAERMHCLGQSGRVVWFTGLSGSGKSSVAFALERKLVKEGRFAAVLDGDSIRLGLCEGLGFGPEARTENLRRVAHVARLMSQSGMIVLCAFVSPTEEMRAFVADLVRPEPFDLVYVDTPISVCETRDVKGLYRRARAGEILDFTGVGAPFEAPRTPSLSLEHGPSLDTWVESTIRKLKLL